MKKVEKKHGSLYLASSSELYLPSDHVFMLTRLLDEWLIQKIWQKAKQKKWQNQLVLKEENNFGQTHAEEKLVYIYFEN